MSSRTRITAALIALFLLVLVGRVIQGWLADEPGMSTRAMSELPVEVAGTWELVQRGGPFPFPRNDGTVFGNRENLLPAKESGYYREYTVPTRGSSDRGARRLVVGGSAELYYTEDHYRSFVRVEPDR